MPTHYSFLELSFKQMNQFSTTPKTTACILLFFLLSSFVFLSVVDTALPGLFGYYVLVLVSAFLLVGLVIFAVRTTLVTWITLMVLLAFSGKRRRVLAREGRKITEDVGMHLVQIVVKEKGLVGLVCATIVGSFVLMFIG